MLRIRVEEGRVNPQTEEMEIAGHTISELHSIDFPHGCRTFELAWNSYVAFTVRNESFTTRDDSEVWQGNSLRRYSVSKVLDFVRTSTFASETYPGPLCHWGVVCAWHVVDVVSVEPPAVRLVASR